MINYQTVRVGLHPFIEAVNNITLGTKAAVEKLYKMSKRYGIPVTITVGPKLKESEMKVIKELKARMKKYYSIRGGETKKRKTIAPFLKLPNDCIGEMMMFLHKGEYIINFSMINTNIWKLLGSLNHVYMTKNTLFIAHTIPTKPVSFVLNLKILFDKKEIANVLAYINKKLKQMPKNTTSSVLNDKKISIMTNFTNWYIGRLLKQMPKNMISLDLSADPSNGQWKHIRSIINVLDISKITEFYDLRFTLKKLYLSNNNIQIEGLGKFTELTHLDISGNRINMEIVKNLIKLTHLDLAGISDGKVIKIRGLEKLINLKVLDLSWNNIKEINGRLDTLKNLEKLNLSMNIEIKIGRGLNELTNLKYLNLSGAEYAPTVIEIEGLDTLTKLECLDLSGNYEITELKGLNTLENLKYLSLKSNVSITELGAGLKNLINLEALYLNYTSITELKGLEDLISLTHLYLDNCSLIEELKGLENSTKLKYLSFTENFLEKILGLGKLTNLEFLDLRAGYQKKATIPNIYGLGELTKLIYLKLEGCNILNIEIEEGKKFPNLTDLNLKNNGLREIEEFGNLINLKRLNLCDNKITKIKGLDNSTNLTSLCLSYNKDITKIEGLDSLIVLTHLYLSNNQGITKMEGLGRLISLTHLYLSGTSITKIEGLGDLIKLKFLDLSHNKGITKIEGFGNLIKLEILYLSHNQGIRKLEGFGSLIALTHLYLSHNQGIRKLEGFGNLIKLKVLDLSHNQGIRKLEGFGNLIALKLLELSHNQGITKIEGLFGLWALTHLNLSYNQNITKIEGLSGLLSLIQLDMSYIYINKRSTLFKLRNRVTSKVWIKENGSVSNVMKGENARKFVPGLKDLKKLTDFFYSDESMSRRYIPSFLRNNDTLNNTYSFKAHPFLTEEEGEWEKKHRLVANIF